MANLAISGNFQTFCRCLFILCACVRMCAQLSDILSHLNIRILWIELCRSRCSIQYFVSKHTLVQCAEAKRGKFKKTPSVCLQSFSTNSFLGLKFHTLLSICIFIYFFERPIMLPAVNILKKILKIENV